MGWRWEETTKKRFTGKSAGFATQDGAKANAVFNAIGRSPASDSERDALWALLEKAGWKLTWEPDNGTS